MVPIKYPIYTASVVLIVIALTACTHSPTAATSPTGQPTNRPTGPTENGDTPSGGFYEGVIGFYTGTLNHLEGVRRGSCPMYPSCSQYSRQAVSRHGFVKGWVMTMDRLMRCGRDELKTAPRVFAHGDWRHYDPVERNDWSALRNETTPIEKSRLTDPYAPSPGTGADYSRKQSID